MKINELAPQAGARPKAFRKARGYGSGNGKTAGRGHKGQKSRSGKSLPLAFEGGQMPIYRRLPKRGFNNKRFAKQYILVNVGELNDFADGTVVDLAVIREAKLVDVPHRHDGLKILGDGELEKNLTVKAVRFTQSAKEKIEKAGGTAEEV